METVENPKEYFEHIASEDEYPSDADVAEAKNLSHDVAEKHRRRKKRLEDQFKKKKDSEDNSAIKEEKRKMRRSLKPKSSTEEIDKEKRASTTEKQLGSVDIPKLSLQQTDESIDPDLNETDPQNKDDGIKTKKPNRLAIAAALREKRRKEKEAELLETKDGEKEDTMRLGDTTDRLLSTRFDPDQIHSSRYRGPKEPEITWEMLKNQENVSDKHAFDFFCKQWPENIPKSKKDSTDKERRPSEEIGEDNELLEDHKHEQFSGLKNSRHFLDKKYPIFIPASEKGDQSAIYYEPYPIDATFEEEFVHRNLEDDGLYVGKRPCVTSSNEKRLQCRVETEKKKEWFGEDGRLRILPDPLKEIPFRPLMWNEQFNPIPSYLKTEIIKPVIIGPGSEHVEHSYSGSNFEMIMNLDRVQFSHHHLFTEEHVYAEKLKQFFILYNYIVKQEGLYYFEQRILSLKHSIEHLKERHRVHEVNNNDELSKETQQRIKSYRQEIKNIRQARNNEEAHLRKIITSIIKTWKQIKKIRSDTNMTLTEVVVKIKKEPTDADEDRRLLDIEINQQIEEYKELYDLNYEIEERAYKEDKMKFERQQQKKQEARSRQEDIRRREEQTKEEDENIDEVELNNRKHDMEILAEPDLSRPVTPVKFNDENCREQIIKEIRESRRNPGEPKIIPILKSGPIQDEQLSLAETHRRHLMTQFSYYGELYFNGKKVVTTSTCQLNKDFMIRFGETIPIIISQYPQLIVLKIFEKSGLSTKLLFNIELDVPSPQRIYGKNVNSEDLEIYNFRTVQILSHKATINAVGSGVQSFILESLEGNPSGDPLTPLYTSGIVCAYSAWLVDDEGVLKIPNEYLMSDKFKNQRHVRDPLLALGLNRILEGQRRQEWKKIESHLDPNNPQDAAVIKALHTNEQMGVDPSGIKATDCFRLNPFMDEFDLTSQEDLDRSVRFRMIILRSLGIPSFINQHIPPYDDKVPVELIREYDQRKTAAKNKTIRSNFEQRKMIHQEFVEKIRDEVMMKFKNSLQRRSLSEMVREEIIPTISEIFPKLKIFNIRRPLERVTESTKPIPIQSIYDMKVDIIVVIKRATDLPLVDERAVRNIHPFVQVQFQNSSRYTSVLEGSNPAWDQELRLRFKPPTSFTTLDAVKDSILINVYDQQVIDMNARDLAKETTVHERYERHNLGSLEIPFNTIYMNGKIEGNFRLNQPAFLQGYTYFDHKLEKTLKSMLSIFIILDPEIHPPQPLKERFDSMEDPDDLTHIERWYNQLSMRFKKRFRRVTVVDMRCQETIITRYISPLKPPQDVPNTPEALANYVSKIPFMADSLVFPGISDIWSTCDQFLKMLIGDEEEHAVLLCNYFMHLYANSTEHIDQQIKVFLCMGQAIPEGETAYVVTISKDEVILWNPSQGLKFNQQDSTCPLFSVGLLVDQNNVWANIQQNVRPCDIKFDITNRSNWQPLFIGPKQEKSRPTVQPEEIIYQEPFLREIEDFQLRLDNDIRTSIMDWRMGYHTNFLLHMRKDIITILTGLETACGHMTDEMYAKLKSVHKGYRVFGFPLNLPYMEVPDLLARVRATGIHLTAAPGVEFAVATHIKAYSNSVLSIWIYVAALTQE